MVQSHHQHDSVQGQPHPLKCHISRHFQGTLYLPQLYIFFFRVTACYGLTLCALFIAAHGWRLLPSDSCYEPQSASGIRIQCRSSAAPAPPSSGASTAALQSNSFARARCFPELVSPYIMFTIFSGFSLSSSPFSRSPLKPCKIDSFGPFGATGVQMTVKSYFARACPSIVTSRDCIVLPCMTRGAGTLYAGDGIVIRQSDSLQGCNALLRYPRSSFASGNMTLCVCCSRVMYCRCCRFPLILLLVYGLEPAKLTTAPSKTCCNQMDRQNFPPIIIQYTACHASNNTAAFNFNPTAAQIRVQMTTNS